MNFLLLISFTFCQETFKFKLNGTAETYKVEEGYYLSTPIKFVNFGQRSAIYGSEIQKNDVYIFVDGIINFLFIF